MLDETHSAIYELKDDMDKGKLSRREFIRYASLLGMSAAAATQMAGLLAFPTNVSAASVRRGGTMKIAAPVQKVTHPAQFPWVSASNQLRQVAEYLTYTDENNVTHPYLLKQCIPRYHIPEVS